MDKAKENIITVRGAVTNVDPAKRQMIIKDENYITYPLRWTPELDVICAKQKPGWRVVVEVVKEEAGGGVIKSIKYDEEFQKKKDRATIVEQKLILLQSCLRTAASVYAVTNPLDSHTKFDDAMDLIISRAIKDSATLLAEARK